jgi:hypothetical protein
MNDPKPKSDKYAWCAPEHIAVAQTMQRKNGRLVITPNPIFAYSAANPPTHVVGAIRRMERR